MNINPDLDSTLKTLAKSRGLDETDSTKIGVMVLSDLFGIAYVESKRGRKVDIEEKEFDLKAAENKRDWYESKGRKVPAMILDDIADLERIIAEAKKDNPIPDLLSAPILSACAARHPAKFAGK